jgi:hypothetical protein
MHYVRFELFTAVTMKNAVFWDVAPCRSYVSRHFWGTYCLHLVGRKIRERGTCVSRWLQTAHPREFYYREEGGHTFLRNVGSHKIYTAPYPRTQHSSNKCIVLEHLRTWVPFNKLKQKRRQHIFQGLGAEGFPKERSQKNCLQTFFFALDYFRRKNRIKIFILLLIFSAAA